MTILVVYDHFKLYPFLNEVSFNQRFFLTYLLQHQKYFAHDYIFEFEACLVDHFIC